MTNEKVYIHEFIDIIGHHRADYMHHMTANWSPIAQEERNQLCYGVWGIVGTTRDWPSVLNLWEEDGFDGMASSFRHELGSTTLQDPKLAKWWAEAARFRSHGTDRLLVPAPWTRTISELCADGVRGEVYAHEQFTCAPGGAAELLARAADAEPLLSEHGWQLAGAWETAMTGDSEIFLLWAIPTWEQWASAEKAERADTKLGRWRRSFYPRTTSAHRFLLVDAELSPFRTGRQPTRADRRSAWTEEES
ncbi:NIPSNAP family containing protein [Cryptosporangium aurantiacum]|uniref:NIPSNAP protein n=1 Tax=Cryptosporangium aurantiacum TaxID=134849 RepID=A0A1M7RKF6_9ACTN|nr:NIPSNAP family containing protein [Cryptosporangium aurantiacum]SHN46548.1 hypothetical protein SAMN05443668_11684 [Cryptosporangium aurantiacum]